MKFKDLVEVYVCLFCDAHFEELESVKATYQKWQQTCSQKDLHELATKCVVGGHQHRVSKKAKNNAISDIENNFKKIFFSSSYKDFEELLDEINKLIGNIPDIGSLTVYDTALRIGYLYNNPICPKDYLYLYCGAYEGAMKLLGGKKLRHKLKVNDFFKYREAQCINGIKELQKLPTSLIEDFFCVMKRYLDKCPSGLIPFVKDSAKYKRIY